MKKQIQIEAVANGFLAREPLHGGVASSPDSVFVFSDAAALGLWVAEYFGGSVPVPAEPEAAPEIDLRTCVEGQKLRLRDGSTAVYDHCRNRDAGPGECPHFIRHAGANTSTAGHDGRWAINDREWDVVEILPLEPSNEPKPITGRKSRSTNTPRIVKIEKKK